MNRRHCLRLLAATACLRPGFLHASQKPPLKFEQPLMGTRFLISCHTDQENTALQAANEAFAHAAKINSVASDYLADSELLSFSQLPHGSPHPVSETLFPLLLQASKLAEKTRGHFDPTLGPLTRLWRETRRRQSLPTPETLAAALAASGHEKLLLDEKNRTLTFTHPGMRLDLGGIAKGQTADAMLAIFVKHGLPVTSVTCGGDVRLGDPPPDQENWKIGIKTTRPAARILQLSNAAVSTSGDLHQSIEIEGVKYSHIINPATGLGLVESRSATVVAPLAAISDALATAACTAPPELATTLIPTAGATELILHR